MSKLTPQKHLSKTHSIVCILALLMPGLASAQQGVPTTQQLREQIILMEKIDRDAATSEEVRNVNRALLMDRRRQLIARVETEIEGLTKYAQTMENALTSDEKLKIGNVLAVLRDELNALKHNDLSGTGIAPEGSPNLNSGRMNKPIAPGLERARELSPNSISNHASPNLTESPLLVAACFPEAPTDLVRVASAAAQLFLRDDDPSSQFGDLTYFAITHTVAVDAGREDLLKAIEVKQLQEQTRRTDKQIGSPATAAGSTTVAEKPSPAEILGFAIHHGAIVQAVNGTTLNLSTTPYALTTFSGGDTQSNYKKHGYLTRLGIGADFNIQNQDALLANARRSQLADWSLRLRLSKDRSTRSDDAEEIWNSISSQFAQPSLVITDMLHDTFKSDVELEAQRQQVEEQTLAMLSEASVKAIRDNPRLTQNQKIDQIAEKIVCRVKADIIDRMRDGSFNINKETRERIIRVTLPAYAVAIKAKEDALKDFDARIEALSLKPIFSFAYTNVRPPAGTNYSELKMLYQRKTAEPISLVANAGISLYHNPNTTMKQQSIRDFAFALAFEGQAGRSPFLTEAKDESQITYSFTGRYQRLLENRLFPGRKADIAIAQFKLNVPMLSGLSFPFSVTFANATELVKEKHVRANFGFSFDADKLLKAIALSKLPSL